MNARPRSRRVLATGGAALLAALLPLLGGCGIRTTTVPVDAGPAPSRVSCQVPKAVNSPGVTDAAVVGIYLVCGMQATPVPRTVSVRPQARGRVEQVRELVAQLNRALTAQEAAAGFTTAVPATLEILGPWPGDPADALRLDAVVEDLPSFALAQIVCTIAQSSLA
ncbi:MAG: hypothetical protein HOY69_31720, partial [Streptomyces sp.]|nr:hypothetical protein [Streptomyces sp.]